MISVFFPFKHLRLLILLVWRRSLGEGVIHIPYTGVNFLPCYIVITLFWLSKLPFSILFNPRFFLCRLSLPSHVSFPISFGFFFFSLPFSPLHFPSPHSPPSLACLSPIPKQLLWDFPGRWSRRRKKAAKEDWVRETRGNSLDQLIMSQRSVTFGVSDFIWEEKLLLQMALLYSRVRRVTLGMVDSA